MELHQNWHRIASAATHYRYPTVMPGPGRRRRGIDAIAPARHGHGMVRGAAIPVTTGCCCDPTIARTPRRFDFEHLRAVAFTVMIDCWRATR
ncbi:hypothetical protein I546_3061 [Mycobacterium kansasii 732]|nr:hypothetical protein I546_3061 [Mycobacterium kansasii 732]